MDFEMHYTAEQEKFRQEVKEWLAANVPADLDSLRYVDPGKLSRKAFDAMRDFRKKLGAKGWLAPLAPKQYGGGGLTTAEAVVIDEEVGNYDMPSIQDLGLSLCAPAVMVWGTDEQKARFLPPIFTGEGLGWQCFTEPNAGTDLASLQSRAIREGDFYILNGSKIFVGSDYDVDFLYVLAITHPENPRHQNIGAFLVPANLPGITIQSMDLIASNIKRTIYFEDVKIPAMWLIGGETDGWRVSQSTFELEHGGSGSAIGRDRFFRHVVNYAKEAKKNGQAMIKDQRVRDGLVDYFINSSVSRLFNQRNYWMRTSRIRWTYEGSQSSMWGKIHSPKNATALMQAFGPWALVAEEDALAPIKGELENQQRQSTMTHPGGTVEAQKIIIARRMGISKTKSEQAATGLAH